MKQILLLYIDLVIFSFKTLHNCCHQIEVMSDEDHILAQPSGSESRVLTAEYKNGQLQIVEMSPYSKVTQVPLEGHILSDSSESSTCNADLKYMQLDTPKNMMDYLNLTFVRCEDGQESYRLVSNTESESGDDTTVTCVLANDDGEGGDNEGDEQENQETYVMVGDQGPLVFLQSSLQPTNTVLVPKKEEVKKPSSQALTPSEILEKAKALQKVKALMAPPAKRGRGRRRHSDLPAPHEMLSSPQFKLYLYSCKLCSFRCNAIKELTVHKAAEHSGVTGRFPRGGGRSSAVTLQCARCPFRGHSHTQLMRHVKDRHLEPENTNIVFEKEIDLDGADVLVCGACGFESTSRSDFTTHLKDQHGSTLC